MITILLGNNASGKTLKLMEMMNNCKDSYSSNIIDSSVTKNIALSDKHCNIAAEIISSKRLLTTRTDVVYAEFFNKEDEDAYSSEFFKLMTIICKDVKEVFLDEPTINMESLEDVEFYKIVEKLSEMCGVNFHITTHNNTFLCMDNFDVVIVENGSVRTDYSEEEFNEMLWTF